MKKILSILIAISLMFVFAIPAFADSEEEGYVFETLFADCMPEYKIVTGKDVIEFDPEVTEFEAKIRYVLYVTTPRSQEYFEADEGSFEGVRGTLVKKDIVAINADIISIEEDDNFDYRITFSPKEEGEFSFAMTMRTFGFDITNDYYRTIEGEDWEYAITTENFTATPSLNPIDYSSSDATSSKDTVSVDTNSTEPNDATSSVIDIDAEPDGGISVWVWIILGVAVVACVVIVLVLNRKKLIK